MRDAALDQRSSFDDPWLDGLATRIWSKPEFSMVPIDVEEVPAQPYAGPRLDDHGLRIVFFGIPSDYGTAFLLHLIEKRVNLVAAVSSTRWQRTHPTPDLVGRIAGHLGRPVEVTANANGEPFVRSLRAYHADVVVMASFDQILTAETLAVPTRGWLNIHPSLLPRHRGPEPIYWTIANGDAVAGITVHLTVPRIDAGPILAQRKTRVAEGETAGTLSKKLVAEGLRAVDETLARLDAGTANATPVDLRLGSYDPPVRQSELNWDQSLQLIDRLVRAGHPDQPPFFTYRGQRRYVQGIRRVRARSGERPGALSPLPAGEMLGVVADAVVAVRWRREGHIHAVRPLAKQQFP